MYLRMNATIKFKIEYDISTQNNSTRNIANFSPCPMQSLEDGLKLPVSQSHDEILQAIEENPVVIIRGETGSGKTTQVRDVKKQLNLVSILDMIKGLFMNIHMWPTLVFNSLGHS